MTPETNTGPSPNRWGGSGGGFGAWGATNLGYSFAKYLLGIDSGSDGPHVGVAVGASQLRGLEGSGAA